MKYGWLAGSLLAGAWFFSGGLQAAPKPDDPFFPDVSYAEGKVLVSFAFATPDLHIYDDMLTCSLGEALEKPDAAGVDADNRLIYGGLSLFTWAAQPGTTFTLGYQGCDAVQCYMPQEISFTIAPDGTVSEGADASLPTPPPALSAPSASSERALSGFVKPAAFLAFLRNEQSPAATQSQSASFFTDPQAWVADNGLWLLILVVFLGGLALNLTPCVLPMMPINLAIIGAGAAGGSRLTGALRGGAYGLGIALAYGILALIPVLTGAAFGAIQSAWWFNAAIAAVFVALALALFDLFMIDFTRFAGAGSGKQGTVAAFVAEAVSAVLAGACVAPVLIAVLLLTADYVAAARYWALCLPFVLGLGMAAPWPIAGAGLSFLPKPGAWMVWVKKIFGVVVLLFAAHYGWTAIRTFLPESGLSGTDLPAIEAAIAEARTAGKPVLLDFWGPACKACDEMEAKTLSDATVQAELSRFAFLKVRMDLADKAIAPTRERFAIQGLPTYIVIE